MERIPIPPYIWWREFCVRVLPLLAFAGAAVGAAWLWALAAPAGGITGVGEGPRSIVSSAQPGLLAHILVEPFEMVETGQAVAVIHPLDARMQLGLLQTEVDLWRLRSQPTLAEENAFDYERLRADLLRTQSELQVAEARLHRSERDVARNTPLYEEELVSADVYETLLKVRDTDLVEALTKSNTVVELGQRLSALRALGVPGDLDDRRMPDPPLAHLEDLRQALATNFGSVTLVAPIDGTVSQVHRLPQEHIVEGEPLVTILASWSEHVVAYLRQPYPFDPSVGERVVVTTRERRRREFASVISRVGAQVEIITNVLAFVRQGALVDAGLPIIVPLPDGLRIRPGEIVDLRLDSLDVPQLPSAPRSASTNAAAGGLVRLVPAHRR